MRKESAQDLQKLPREDSISRRTDRENDLYDDYDIKKFRKCILLTRGTVLMGR